MIADISSEMIEAGERVILEEPGGADLGGLFSASELAELAEKIYLAMQDVHTTQAYRRILEGE